MQTEIRLPEPNGSVLPLDIFLKTRYIRIMKTNNVYEEYLVQKGYTLSEIRKVAPVADKRVPERFRDRYSTYEEYREAIADFLNGN
jgi:hypothetical protein